MVASRFLHGQAPQPRLRARRAPPRWLAAVVTVPAMVAVATPTAAGSGLCPAAVTVTGCWSRRVWSRTCWRCGPTRGRWRLRRRSGCGGWWRSRSGSPARRRAFLALGGRVPGAASDTELVMSAVTCELMMALGISKGHAESAAAAGHPPGPGAAGDAGDARGGPPGPDPGRGSWRRRPRSSTTPHARQVQALVLPAVGGRAVGRAVAAGLAGPGPARGDHGGRRTRPGAGGSPRSADRLVRAWAVGRRHRRPADRSARTPTSLGGPGDHRPRPSLADGRAGR